MEQHGSSVNNHDWGHQHSRNHPDIIHWGSDFHRTGILHCSLLLKTVSFAVEVSKDEESVRWDNR